MTDDSAVIPPVEPTVIEAHPSAESLPLESRKAVRLAAVLWLAAEFPFVVISIAVLTPVSSARTFWSHFLRVAADSLSEPNIVNGVGHVAQWNQLVFFKERVVHAFMGMSVLAWILACWLLADVKHGRFRLTSLCLRIVSSAAAVIPLVLFPLFLSFQIARIWLDAVYLLDTLLALLVALHLRALAQLIADLPLSRICGAVLLFIGLWAFGEAGMCVTSDRIVEYRCFTIRQLALVSYSVLIAMAMARLWLLMRRSLKATI